MVQERMSPEKNTYQGATNESFDDEWSLPDLSANSIRGSDLRVVSRHFSGGIESAGPNGSVIDFV